MTLICVAIFMMFMALRPAPAAVLVPNATLECAREFLTTDPEAVQFRRTCRGSACSHLPDRINIRGRAWCARQGRTRPGHLAIPIDPKAPPIGNRSSFVPAK